MKSQRKSHNDLDDQYRYGGPIKENRDQCRDTLTEMRMAEHHPEALSGQLKAMGITENGDDPADETDGE
jgi:hypothetical protein